MFHGDLFVIYLYPCHLLCLLLITFNGSLVSCSVGTHYDGDQGRCVLCPAGTYQDDEAQTSCEVCPRPEGRELSKVVGAGNLSECGGETIESIWWIYLKITNVPNWLVIINVIYTALLKQCYKVLFVVKTGRKLQKGSQWQRPFHY